MNMEMVDVKKKTSVVRLSILVVNKLKNAVNNEKYDNILSEN
jgi:hypothetical protein